MRITIKKRFVLFLLLVFCGTLIFGGDIVVASCKNWPKVKKTDWNIVGTLSVGNGLEQMSTGFLDRTTWGKRCHLQGATLTEKYYVFSRWCGDGNKSQIVLAERGSNRIIDTASSTRWGHMNVFYYKWGSNHVLVNTGSSNVCFDVSDGTLKKIRTKSCKTSRSLDYGVPKFDVHGNVVKNGLTGQGEAMVGNYVFTVGFDAGCHGRYQKWGYKRNLNALFIFSKSPKKLLKTFILSSPNGETEDISIDGDGNVWIIYQVGRRIIYYKVDCARLGLSNCPAQSSSSSSGSSSNNGSSSGSSSGGNTEYYYDGEVETAILEEDSVEGILKLVVGILLGGIPVAGVIGIVIAGVQYLTAGGDEGKAKKAKLRIYEIILGLVVYAMGYALLSFLGVA